MNGDNANNKVVLQKAKLIELDAEFAEKDDGKIVEVQFNPETLKVSFANQIVQPNNAGAGTNGAGSQSGPASRQFVGAGTTKLTLQLWFDVNGPLPKEKEGILDVRELTKEVAFFITPVPEGENFIPPAVKFLWGSFHFDGLVDSMDESLEFFSKDGVPLRASMNINMSQQRIQEFSGKQGRRQPSGPGGSGAAPAGTRPLERAPAGSTLQGLAANLGQAANWRDIADAGGIENPRLLQPGQLIDMNVRIPRNVRSL